jgi:hypothetical protein
MGAEGTKMNDDFKNYPKSITEIKANKDENAATWTPRDAIISFLRRLDAGEFPNMDTLVIIGTRRDGPKTSTHYSVSSPALQDTLGAIELGRLKMYADGKES